MSSYPHSSPLPVALHFLRGLPLAPLTSTRLACLSPPEAHLQARGKEVSVHILWLLFFTLRSSCPNLNCTLHQGGQPFYSCLSMHSQWSWFPIKTLVTPVLHHCTSDQNSDLYVHLPLLSEIFSASPQTEVTVLPWVSAVFWFPFLAFSVLLYKSINNYLSSLFFTITWAPTLTYSHVRIQGAVHKKACSIWHSAVYSRHSFIGTKLLVGGLPN